MKKCFNYSYTIMLSLLGLLLFGAHSAQAQVTVRVNYPNSNNSIELTYPQPVRLEQVINDARNHQISPFSPIFWTGATLFKRHQDNKLKSKKQLVISSLERFALDNDREQASILSLKYVVLSLQLSKRIFQSLDPDLIRLQPALNSILNGNYLLTLPSRPDSVLILGAVNQPISIPWKERADANYYRQQAQVTTGANKDYAWVIQPDGQVQKHPIAYWNYQHRDIAPGAIIYLAFDGLSANYDNLDQDIIQLLRNRVSE